MRHARSRIASLLIALVAAVAGFAAPALAADSDPDGGLWINSGTISDGELVFIVGLPGSAALDPGSEISASIRLDGRDLPARAEPIAAPEARSVVIMLDTSGSMRGEKLVRARSAILNLIVSLPEGTRIGIGTFADSARVLVKPTLDRDRVVEALAGLKAEGSTSLYDGAARALASLPQTGRVILVSDGADTASTRTIDSLLEELRRTPLPVDVIAITPDAQELDTLRRIADVSDGTITSTSAEEVVAAIERAGQVFGPRLAVIASAPAGAAGEALVTVTVDGRSWSGRAQAPRGDSQGAASVPTIEPPVDPAPATAAQPAGNWPALVLAGAGGLAASLLALSVLAAAGGARRRRRTEDLLEDYAPTPPPEAGPATQTPLWARLSRALARSRSHAAIAAQLDRAELPISPLAWVSLRLAGMAILGVLLAVVLRSAPIGLLVGGILAWIGEEVYLHMRIERRLRAFEAELPDFLTLTASGLRSGLSVTQAVANAGSEAGSAGQQRSSQLARQMRRALLEVQMGSTLDEALMRVAERMDSTDLRWTVQALSIQREVGGSLSSILDTAVATIRGRAQLRREVRTLSAEGRLSANILLALPLLVFAFLALTRRDYLQIFWTEPVGYLMLAMVGVLLVVGTLWIRSVTRIQV